MTRVFSGRLFTVYVSPASIHVLYQRLAKDGRDTDGTRLASAEQELKKYWSLEYEGLYDLEVVSEDNKISEITTIIYNGYLKSIK